MSLKLRYRNPKTHKTYDSKAKEAEGFPFSAEEFQEIYERNKT